MDGWVFIVVIVLFSLLDGVLRKQKAARAAEALPPGQEPEPGGHEPMYDAEPSFDEQHAYEPPSFDDRPSYDEEIDDDVAEYSSPSTAVSRSTPAPPTPLIPRDIWEEEIAGLVSGVQASEPPAPPEPRREATTVARRASFQPTTPEQEHFVHRSHADYGTDPSSRAPSEQDGLDPLARHLGADAGAAHKLLSSGDPHALRRAIILQEILGPPAAFRGDPYEPR
jgi:hypothetical protein